MSGGWIVGLLPAFGGLFGAYVAYRSHFGPAAKAKRYIEILNLGGKFLDPDCPMSLGEKLRDEAMRHINRELGFVREGISTRKLRKNILVWLAGIAYFGLTGPWLIEYYSTATAQQISWTIAVLVGGSVIEIMILNHHYAKKDFKDKEGVLNSITQLLIDEKKLSLEGGLEPKYHSLVEKARKGYEGWPTFIAQLMMEHDGSAQAANTDKLKAVLCNLIEQISIVRSIRVELCRNRETVEYSREIQEEYLKLLRDHTKRLSDAKLASKDVEEHIKAHKSNINVLEDRLHEMRRLDQEAEDIERGLCMYADKISILAFGQKY